MPRSILFIALLGAAVSGCQSTPGPDATARAYVRALEEGRLEDAWALTSRAHHNPDSRAAFERRYADPKTRAERARAIEAALPELKASAGPVMLVREEGVWRVREPDPEQAARTTLEAFIAATEQGNFTAAWALLGAALRARYTPERLAADYRAEPLAAERLARAKVALAHPPIIEEDLALFPIGDGRAVRLRLEEGGYRVVAIE